MAHKQTASARGGMTGYGRALLLASHDYCENLDEAGDLVSLALPTPDAPSTTCGRLVTRTCCHGSGACAVT
jgi:hypothetical protein